MKYKINFLVTICLINIFTINFSQDCCEDCDCCEKCWGKKEGGEEGKKEGGEEEEKKRIEEEKKRIEERLKREEEEKKKQEEYLKSLLENFDKNIKKFDDSIFSENTDSTDVEYTIVKEGTQGNDGILGKGSFGTVYKVKNKKGKFFALKKAFIPEKEESATKKEIQILIKCRDCKNVIKIVDAYKNIFIYTLNPTTNGYHYYIVTELYQGGDLKDFIEKCKNNSTGLADDEIEEKKRKYMYQMINAVKQIHDKGIIHRDIKPANFFIGENDNLYLGDFGIATEEYDKTFLIGTPLYMYFFLNYMVGFMEGNPNIVNSLLKHCDLYSLMCTIFELVECTFFTDYSGNFNVVYQNIFYNENFNLLCPKIDFIVTIDVVNQIISAQGNLWQQIQNNQFMQNNCMNYFFQIQLMQLMQLIQEGGKLKLDFNMFSFSPILRWNNYLFSKNINIILDKCAFMLNQIIQNLFITKFTIDDVLKTPCFNYLDNLYKNNY